MLEPVTSTTRILSNGMRWARWELLSSMIFFPPKPGHYKISGCKVKYPPHLKKKNNNNHNNNTNNKYKNRKRIPKLAFSYSSIFYMYFLTLDGTKRYASSCSFSYWLFEAYHKGNINSPMMKRTSSHEPNQIIHGSYV